MGCASSESALRKARGIVALGWALPCAIPHPLPGRLEQFHFKLLLSIDFRTGEVGDVSISR